MAVNVCKVCEQTYVTMHLGDVGMCRLCEIREHAWRRKIAGEIHALGGSAFLVESVRRGSAYPDSKADVGERGHPSVEY
jgi:hypothetical protein